LCEGDAVMAALLARQPHLSLTTRGDPFITLIRAVVGQQISVKAADSVWVKTLACMGDTATPEGVLAVPVDTLRGCGLSGQKVGYILAIAEGFTDGTVHPDLWDGMTDDEVIDELMALKGIGRWTAEMFLIFNLRRPDVLPLDDLGLLKNYALAYGNVPPPKPRSKLTPYEEKSLKRAPKAYRDVARRLLRQARVWHPYQTLATQALWRSLDPVDVSY